ncbi:hypothetical protein NBRC111894_1571 [Sporolactobacillus inulinus]|uniref:Uncharacterized protein n=1 Tax=Sporolactobacillus inulinus TaxID=2078 RepID=A0A4Y1ZAD9_9BACL|nr:hypothetical protein NBRC111894_1571 [Sporolactobacillus inulinus]
MKANALLAELMVLNERITGRIYTNQLQVLAGAFQPPLMILR